MRRLRYKDLNIGRVETTFSMTRTVFGGQ